MEPQLIHPPTYEEIVDFVKLQKVDIYELLGVGKDFTKEQLAEHYENIIIQNKDLRETFDLAYKVLGNKRLRYLYDNFYSKEALKKNRIDTIKTSVMRAFETLQQPFLNLSFVCFASEGTKLTPLQVFQNRVDWKWLFRGMSYKMLSDFLVKSGIEILSGMNAANIFTLPLCYLVGYPATLISNLSVLQYTSTPTFLATLDKVLDFKGRGFFNLYHGFSSYLAMNMVLTASTLALGQLDQYIQRKSQEKPESKALYYLSKITSSQLFGVFTLFTIATPFNVIQLNYQKQILTGQPQSLISLVKSLYTSNGIYKFYHGGTTQLLSFASIYSLQYLLSRF
ncbi:hypothetical protein DLAC_10505 [Tieghemostelium lacteum]|uniref:J domain-containing protein n=1 Tax=Tieghemostelium lacteum TaxID=361077 RepID=A0A151Z547_TIELA|nr:hypothetical protein DLAC_10505 [Tieghemostelium lacteum]|eukprot:KYQ88924.1 hypothetical protein DLAC_10505 [Tieghemostelium lacteum]